jgi:hypothetical protein
MEFDYSNLKAQLRTDIIETYYLRAKDTEKNSLHQYKGTMGVQKTFRMLICQRRYNRQRLGNKKSDNNNPESGSVI